MLIYTRRVIVASMLTFFTYSCSNNTEHINRQLVQENASLQLQLARLSARVVSMTHGQNHPENASSKADLLSESDIDFSEEKD